MLCSIFSCRHSLLTGSKKYVWNTTAKDIVMPLLLIFVCALWYHDVWFLAEGRAYKKKRNHNYDRV